MADSVGIGVFIDHDDKGQPFAGLEVITPISRDAIYIGGGTQVMILADTLVKVAQQLKEMPKKTVIVEAKGMVPGGRTRQ